MVLKQQLHQKQVQKLILAPALQQAIKLLPLTNLELIEIINQELSENPVLEIAGETEEKKTEKEESTSRESPEDESKEPDLSQLLDSEGKDDELEIKKFFQEYFDDGIRSYSTETQEAPSIENYVSKGQSLWDHLEWQANLTFFEDEDRKIARHIIGNINDDGYLVTSEEDIARTLNTKIEKVSSIREKIKRFDPIGVGSLTLKETLLAQMEHLNIDDDILKRMISEFLPLLEKSDFSRLSKELDVPLDEIKTRLDVIRGFNPTPGVKYSTEKTHYVVPDIEVTKEDEELKITINDDGLPQLRISGLYKKLLLEATKEKSEAYPFLKERMKKAFWFLRSLDQRNQTIYKVAKYILKAQKDFIEKGIDYIKPLTLMELAEEIGVHESTVGRVVSNKYMMTPRGLFPLKYFFHKSLKGDFGEGISSLRVKERIKKMVENEDRKSPLSDIEIEEILSKENFRIARRTVAKYRKQLGIEPSHIRKRKYWMEKTI